MSEQEGHKERKISLDFREMTLWKVGTFAFALLFIVSLITNGFRGADSQGGKITGSAAVWGSPSGAGSTPPQAEKEVYVDVSEDDDPVIGDEDAPVTIIEFSDYQCPYCGTFWEQTLPEIKRQYIDTGKVRFVYRDLPLLIHPMAQKAAEAANCAGEQGKYWEMHNLIFAGQASLSLDNLRARAKKLDLKMNDFNSCLDSGRTATEIAKDMADADAAGATGTPTFFINGRMLEGAHPFAAFEKVIEQELAK